MNIDQLTENQKQIVSRLPYRAGLFVSQSDDEGGDEANQNELLALHNLIYGFAESVFGSELIQYVMEETIKQKDSWSQWDNDLELVPSECEEAVSILSHYADSKEVKAYAARIMDIGEAVALAFREDSYEPTWKGRLKARIDYWMACKQARAAKMPMRSFEDFLSISAEERVALQKMARAFGIFYI